MVAHSGLQHTKDAAVGLIPKIFPEDTKENLAAQGAESPPGSYFNFQENIGFLSGLRVNCLNLLRKRRTAFGENNKKISPYLRFCENFARYCDSEGVPQLVLTPAPVRRDPLVASARSAERPF